MERINYRLKVRREDEAFLYAAEKYNLDFSECKNICCLMPKDLNVRAEDTGEKLWEEVYEECYLVSRYREILLKWDKFNYLVESILEKAERCNRKPEAAALMEQMMLYQGDYFGIEEAGWPILLYKGDEVCHRVLDGFAEQLGEAFEHSGQEVEYFDLEKEGIYGLARLAGRNFQAIIGMQSPVFWVKMENGMYLHDYIKGPKYIFIFDHPVRMKEYLSNVPKNFHVLTHDTNYVRFIENYFNYRAYFWPLAGKEVQLENLPKIYDISFVGTYNDYRKEMRLIHSLPREIRFMANHFLRVLRKNPNLTAEEALSEVFDKKGHRPSKEEFLERLWDLRAVLYCVIHYYRYRIIKQLLDAELQIDVFGENWQSSPLSVYSNLICHPDIDYEKNIQVFQQSKLSLNIMAWHKGGFTERMANIMLSKTVLVTDYTTYLHERYMSDEDLVVFQLNELEKLPEKLKCFLENDEKRLNIAANGWEKAHQYETWDVRVRDFLHVT